MHIIIADLPDAVKGFLKGFFITSIFQWHGVRPGKENPPDKDDVGKKYCPRINV